MNQIKTNYKSQANALEKNLNQSTIVEAPRK